MRENRTPPRGETARVAARVRALLDESGDDARPGEDDYPDGFSSSSFGAHSAAHDERHLGPSLWDRVAAHVPVRLDPGRRSAVAVGLAVLLAAVVTGVWLMSSRPQAVPVSASVPSVPGAAALVGTDGVTEGATETSSVPLGSTSAMVSSAVGSSATSKLVVDVAGKVRDPGVYRLRMGSRVDDAIEAAGGPVGHVDLSTLNLAAPLVDGQQVAVGVPQAADGAVVPAAGDSSLGADATGTIVDLNTATLEQLESLPGVGPVLGQDILDYRNAHGSFASIDQLTDVSGIGDVTFGDLKSLVSV